MTPFSSQNGYIYNLALGIQEISTKKLDVVPSEVYGFLNYNGSFSDNVRILKSKFFTVGKIGGEHGAQVVFSYNEQTNSVIINQVYPYSGWSCVIIAIKL